MTTRPLFRLLPRLASRGTGPARPPAPRRRRTPRTAALAFGLLFGAVTLALTVAADTVRPEWRDPEYAYRLRAARRWQAERPDRPLVMVVGSSRTQMGVSPADMGFPGAPGSPLVYNFGYRNANPLGAWLHVQRALDDGLRPRAVLVVFSGDEIRVPSPPEELAERWGSRLTGSDLRRLEPYASPGADLAGAAGGLARRNPWGARKPALVADLRPGLRPPEEALHRAAWERMDGYGFSPYPGDSIPPDVRAFVMEQLRVGHVPLTTSCGPAPVAVRALRDLVGRCRAEGIAVACCWAPDGPDYRALCYPNGTAANDVIRRDLAADLGVPFFPAPDDLTEAEFADVVHLNRPGAARYSRWLADNHLKPWLAQVLK